MGREREREGGRGGKGRVFVVAQSVAVSGFFSSVLKV